VSKYLVFLNIVFALQGNFLVDLIFFSFDRPMQLYALLESTEKFVSHHGKIHVICRSSNNSFLDAYKILEKRFNKVNFVYQAESSEFKHLLMNLFNANNSDYICFGVDDIIVKDYIDLSFCAIALKKYKNAYGFYLRLGKNIDYCYSENIGTPAPKMDISQGLCLWKFADGKGDWNYPNTVDMTIYKKNEILADIEKCPMSNPSNFENQWAVKADHNKYGICFYKSKIVNIPLNVVDPNNTNRHMNNYSCNELLEKFNCGYKIDINKLFRIDNRSPHFAFPIEFINR